MNKMLWFVSVFAVVAVSIVVVVSQSDRSDDPIVDLMSILDKHTRQCAKELLAERRMGDECRSMINVGDSIFKGDPNRWGQDMLRRGVVNVNNISTVTDTISLYAHTIDLLLTLEHAPRTQI